MKQSRQHLGPTKLTRWKNIVSWNLDFITLNQNFSPKIKEMALTFQIQKIRGHIYKASAIFAQSARFLCILRFQKKSFSGYDFFFVQTSIRVSNTLFKNKLNMSIAGEAKNLTSAWCQANVSLMSFWC